MQKIKSMKKYLTLFLIPLFAWACKGPAGPQGPPGEPGLIGQAFEVKANFTPDDYSQIFGFPQEITVLDTDVVMAYLLWEVNEETGNDVWQPLPVSVFFDDGELQYAFDHTQADIQLFLTGNTDLSTVGSEWTQDQIFRVVILPVDYIQSNNISLKDAKAVMKLVDKPNIKRYGIKRLQ